jgi:hypothetical protein
MSAALIAIELRHVPANALSHRQASLTGILDTLCRLQFALAREAATV